MRVAYLVQGIGFVLIAVALVYAMNARHVAAPEEVNEVMSNHSPMSTLTLTSTAFHEGESIPSFFSCDGANTAPPLSVTGVPEGTVSLTLTVDDPDIPASVKQLKGIEVYDHWVLFNIPPTTNVIDEDSVPEAVVGTNSSGSKEYVGPCPPDGEHRYFFKLYALDTILELPEGATKAEVEAAMEGHVLEETTLIGRYARSEQ